jgi:hypothetical protein
MQGKKTGGRRKGTPNRVTSLVREAIESAAEELGGATRLAAWAKEDPSNERAFWASIYPKLLPMQVTGSGDRDLLPPVPTITLTGRPQGSVRRGPRWIKAKA